MKLQLSNAELDGLRSLLRSAGELGIGIVAVGANARLLAFNIPYGIPAHRTTTDWDFGVNVGDWTAFERLRKALLGVPGQFEAGHHLHTLVHKPSGLRVDLVPFGGIAKDGLVSWPDSQMNILGFPDALEGATAIRISNDIELPVATVPHLAALKFIAFADRKDRTSRDLEDLWHIMTNYRVREAELFEPPFSTIGSTLDWRHAGALLLGVDIGRSSGMKVLDRMMMIVEELVDPYTPQILPLVSRHMSEEDERTQREDVAAGFGWLLMGLEISRPL